MELEASRLARALDMLGALLADRGHRIEIVAVGGSSLLLLGLLSRPTKDLDVVALREAGRYVSADPLPAALIEARADVARALDLAEDWINAGPASLLEHGLPPSFEERIESREFAGLVVHIAGRRDQIFLKLYAAVDQGMQSKHAQDLRALAPSAEELVQAARWARTHDPSDGFRALVLHTLDHFGVEADDADL